MIDLELKPNVIIYLVILVQEIWDENIYFVRENKSDAYNRNFTEKMTSNSKGEWSELFVFGQIQYSRII